MKVEQGIAVIIICSVVLSVLAGPAVPDIPDQFYSEVRVAVRSGSHYAVGGGILAYDVPNNMGRTDYRVEEDHQMRSIHILERYDQGEIYDIIDHQKCEAVPVTGKIASPFAWVANAVYNGTSNYHGKQHDVWALDSTDSNGEEYQQRLYVDSNNPNTPSYYTTLNVSSTDKHDYHMEITFLTFTAKEPESWVFNVPTTCGSNLTAPMSCNSGAVVYWANSNWNCGDQSCSYRVASGAAQPGYECAEFTARALAAGGYMINLGPNDPQSSYANFRGYDLLYVSGLNSFFGAVGTYTQHPASAGSVQPAYAILGNGGGGAWSHACIGIAAGRDDCHNIARQDWPSSGSFYAGVDAVWAPPGC